MSTTRKLTLTITLESDLCSASGDGFAGVVDTDVTYDSFGLPFIPSKRVKGCLREAALEILEIEPEREEAFLTLFGLPGQSASGGLTIGNGMLENHVALAAEAEEKKYFPDAVLSCYTSVRTRTRIENGYAADKSLRSARVVNSGNIFRFDVECPDDSDVLSLLKRSCKLLRHMGLNRTRGLGEVTCTLEGANASSHMEFTIADYYDRKQIAYTLLLDEPTICADRHGKPFACEETIMGSAIQGWLVSRWFTMQGNSQETLRGEAFPELFRTNQVTFTFAFPTIGERIFHHAPFTLRTDKECSKVADESEAPAVPGPNELPYSKRLGGFASTENNIIYTHNVSKDVFMHHARPTDKRIAHATAAGGQLFSYEALSTGQSFSGAIIGGEEALTKIKELLEENLVVRIGRSTTAQYGKAHIMPTAPLPNKELIVPANGTFRMVVRTPLIIKDHNGTVTPDLSLIPELLGYPSLVILKTFCSETVASGYNTKWRLPRPQFRALAEGSVVVMKNTSNVEITMPALMLIGLRIGSGYGEVSLEDIPRGTLQLQKNDLIPVPLYKSGTELTGMINKRKDKAQENKEGSDYALRVLDYAPTNSQFARLINFLAKSSDFNDLTKRLLDVKQPVQKRRLLAFCTGETESWFDTQILECKNIKLKVEEFAEKKSFDSYKEFLFAAIRQIKQIRRAKQKSDGDATKEGTV
jgi:CRISPR-associated protein Csx10